MPLERVLLIFCFMLFLHSLCLLAVQVAVCNLASIAVNMYVDEKKKRFDFAKFREVIKVMVRNLNRIIDINYYPVNEVSSEHET